MKLSLIILSVIVLLGFTQKEKKVNHQYYVSLKKGVNSTINYKTLTVEPTNLFIQSRPWNDKSVHIQLEMNVKENDQTYHTFLWYNEKGSRTPPTNYPMAWGKYSYGLEVSKKDEVSFTIDELTFGSPFYIELNKKAAIGELAVNFSESIDVMGQSVNGSQNDSYAEYQLLVSDTKEETKLKFTSLNVNNGKIQVLKWKNYDIAILETEIDALKIKISKH
jgi:hypothetical protein